MGPRFRSACARYEGPGTHRPWNFVFTPGEREARGRVAPRPVASGRPGVAEVHRVRAVGLVEASSEAETLVEPRGDRAGSAQAEPGEPAPGRVDDMADEPPADAPPSPGWVDEQVPHPA